MLAANDERLIYDNFFNLLIVLHQLYKTGTVLEDGKWPYEGIAGRRRKAQLLHIFHDYLYPAFSIQRIYKSDTQVF
eukprot:snap_masked-scaffold_7-processed-gene-6.27-mRNA-1 protein AED:1.00 eAED:1.00 QI:0/0/0/0/1/1/2/0/75